MSTSVLDGREEVNETRSSSPSAPSKVVKGMLKESVMIEKRPASSLTISSETVPKTQEVGQKSPSVGATNSRKKIPSSEKGSITAMKGKGSRILRSLSTIPTSLKRRISSIPTKEKQGPARVKSHADSPKISTKSIQNDCDKIPSLTNSLPMFFEHGSTRRSNLLEEECYEEQYFPTTVVRMKQSTVYERQISAALLSKQKSFIQRKMFADLFDDLEDSC